MSKPPCPRHFNGVQFFNYWSDDPKTGTAVRRWMLSRTPAVWPLQLENPPPAPVQQRVFGTDMRITMIGHASLLVQTAGLNILTDPVWSKRTSPVQFAGPKRVRAPGIARDALPPIDVIIVSHNHFDHMDLPTLEYLVARHRPHIITPLGNARYMPGTITELDWDASHSIGDMAFVCEPVQHWSRRQLTDENKALWAGFTLKSLAGNIYFAGDTGFHPYIFERAKARHKGFRCALLPIGAYAPRWFMAYQHMNPREAVTAKALLDAQHAIGIHHGVWQLTDEPIDEPEIQLRDAMAHVGMDPALFRTLLPGQAWDVPG